MNETSIKSLNEVFYFNNKDTLEKMKNFKNIFDKKIDISIYYSNQ